MALPKKAVTPPAVPVPPVVPKAVAPVVKAPLVPAADYGDFRRGGFENVTKADVTIPLLYVLQDGSPQVKKSEAKYVEGAESGMFLDSVSGELYSGADGILLVPCSTDHYYTEWTPRAAGGGGGQGFKGQHAVNSPVVLKAKPVDRKLVTEQGTELVETFAINALVLAGEGDVDPVGRVCVPFTSTKIKAYRRAMTQMSMVRGNPPLFAHRIRLTTVLEKNTKGTFWSVKIQPMLKDLLSSMIPPTIIVDGNPAPHPLLLIAKEFNEQIKSGAVKAAAPDAGADAGEREAGADIPF